MVDHEIFTRLGSVQAAETYARQFMNSVNFRYLDYQDMKIFTLLNKFHVHQSQAQIENHSCPEAKTQFTELFNETFNRFLVHFGHIFRNCKA